MENVGTTRADPDALLKQLQNNDNLNLQRRGKLRVYFGASAGVGKTYAMLSAAQRAVQAGQTVLLGLIETHGRKETQALLQNLNQLPLRDVPYGGQTLKEFDLDAALAAHPEILLVDELPHSNAPGSRHRKRWQDIEELLAAGIEVWTALNVQHLESLNGTVGAITGIRVNETVPDTVLENADEIILIDVTVDALLARLKAGKVYVPQQAQHATENFFKKGNLIALREIALRRTAEHVGDDVRAYRAQQVQTALHHRTAGTTTISTNSEGRNGSETWSTSGTIMACIGTDDFAEHAARSAARLADQLNVQWHAVYVESATLQRRAATDRDRTLSVLKLAEELGATTSVLTGEDLAITLLQHAQTLNCNMLMIGRSSTSLWRRLQQIWTPTLIVKLAVLAPAIDVIEVGTASAARRLSSPLPATLRNLDDEESSLSTWPSYAWAFGACILTTLLTAPLLHRFDLANIVMLFLFCVVLVAAKLGKGPAIFAAVLSVASFDYFYVEPRFSFAVSDVQYLVTFAIMLGVGLLIGQLTANLRFAAKVSSSRERRAAALFALARDLSGALQTVQVVELGEAAVKQSFGGDARVLLPDANNELVSSPNLPNTVDISIADWAFKNGQCAGLATTTLSANAWQYMPLRAPMRVRGVLAINPAAPRWLFIPEQVQQLETLARQIAIALERVHYVDVAQSAVVEMESERLRNTLLATMSHDVRTPLTALLGQADALANSPSLNSEQRESAQAIALEARELSALVSNLLEMAKLESGNIVLRKDWQSVEEVVGGAIRAARHALGKLSVRTEVPANLPLVEFDAGLIERVLVNLLENAARYGVNSDMSKTDGAIIIGAEARIDTLVLKVRDFGPGLPMSYKDKANHLFEKFTRGENESSKRGAGLGLAICNAIVDAHKGKISVTPANGGGVEFTVILPRSAPPELPIANS